MGKLSSENIIKGRIGEAIAEEMFKEMGFFVMKLIKSGVSCINVGGNLNLKNWVWK